MALAPFVQTPRRPTRARAAGRPPAGLAPLPRMSAARARAALRPQTSSSTLASDDTGTSPRAPSARAFSTRYRREPNAGDDDDDDDAALLSPFAAKLAARLAALRAQILTLKERIEGRHRALEEDIDWAVSGVKAATPYDFRVRRSLEGHRAPVYAVAWARDDVTLASASIDGRVIVWDAFTKLKRGFATLESPWVMTVDVSPDDRLLATGGVDAAVTVFSMRQLCDDAPAGGATPFSLRFEGHDGYVTATRFLTADRLVSASGDATLGFWDVVTGARLAAYRGHAADATALAAHPHDATMFASAGADGTLKLWDARVSEDRACFRTYTGFSAFATGVAFFRNGVTLAGTGGDSTLRIFDLRTTAPLSILTDDSIASPATGLSISLSGRVVFVTYEAPVIIAWEPIAAAGTFHELLGHTERAACVAVNASGEALATGGWDRRVAVWA